MSEHSSGGFAQVARLDSADTPLRKAVRALLLALLLSAAWSATFILYTSPESVRVVVGEPSPRDIKAPRQVTYISEVKTNEARLAAMAAVEDVYSGPDMAIASQQVRRLQEITDYITALRYDAFVDQETKVHLLCEIPALQLTPETASRILGLDEDQWRTVASESLRVLDLVMREEIRDHRSAEVRHQIQRHVTHSLPAPQQAIVNVLVQGLVVPNSYYDSKQTLANREAARNAVEPVHWTILEGESILREGEIVTELALEKLQVLGLLNTGIQWQERLSMVLFSIALVTILSVYIARTQPELLSRPRRQLLLVVMLIIVGVAARMTIPGRTLAPYLFPAAAAAMLTAILLDIQLAMVTAGIVALLVGFNTGGPSLELALYAFAGGAVAALAIWRTEQLGSFVRATVYIALANVTIILIFHLRSRAHDAVGLLQLTISGIGNALFSSALTFAAFSFIGRLFGITTSLQLLELARPTHPLFRQLLIKAPGTYHHSIIISNMAEQAAEAIGADALLSRVGSYYHDVGKIPRPYFFSENQQEGDNPHDKLDPKTSAEIIIAHTRDGLALARKYNLPDRVCDFIPEHHGTYLVSYFYHRANQENGEPVSEADFRYPGPKPQSRETAIVMLADSIEAAVRATRPATQADLERTIRQIIESRLMDGQLDECDLTLRDLERIRQAFTTVLQGIFHPRIQYPAEAPTQSSSSESSPPAQANV